VRFRGVAVALVLLATATPSWAQDFDPHGHRHHAPAPGPSRPPPKPGAAPTPGAAPAPSQTVLIERYSRVVLAQPGASFPLQRLSQLYRDRDGSIAKLVADFEVRAAQPGPEQYAATVALAGLYKIDGRAQEAIAALERAIPLGGGDPTAILTLAHLHQDRGDLAAAHARYLQALPMLTVRADKEQTLRTLMTIALDEKDWASAKEFHGKLDALDPTSLFLKGELGHALYDRGEYERAEEELKTVVAAAAGDNRALVPALRELGRAQAKAQEGEAALDTLKRALALAGNQTALRAQIYETIAEIYRADQRLPVLVKMLEDEHPADFERLSLLGGLYEETGESSKAIEVYRRALASAPRQLDIRLRLIRLLQANGDLDAAIAEYEGLIRAAPNNPQFVFEECEALLQRGDRARALRLVSELEARASNDEEVMTRVADFYARIGDSDKSLRVLQRLAQGSTGDAGHLVDLGDRYFQDGDVPLAMQTWKRILSVVQPRAKGLAAYADVLLEHDMIADALAAYRTAVDLDPSNLAFKKALASAYERNRSYRDARILYEEVAARAKEKGDATLLRECRTRIVTLWGLERVLEQQLPALRQAFESAPPDLDAGRTLAEAQLHLRRLPDAEATLRRVIELAPGDAESYLALERVLVQESKIAEAIGVLERLTRVEPKRAREIYERMAQYALQIYKDDDAIKYAARAVELNPDDAEGHRRLGEMYRSKQDTDRAIVEFRAAIVKNDRLFPVYFELADLLLSKDEAAEADRLFRRVLRGAPDEDLVARAARLSIQINLGRGTLESLEQDVLPLAIGNPQRTIYRRLLVEIYGSLTFGLMQRVRHGTPSEADEARAGLARIGARAVKPLLDALADADVSQQSTAIDVLAYVQNRNTALPLFAYATGPAELSLRTRAMIACGAVADASLVPKYEALLYPKNGASQAGLADAVAEAAVWGLARMRDPRAAPLLRAVARDGTPAMRALAALGLGEAHDVAAVADVASMAASADSGSVARAAAAYALGDLGARKEVPTLLEIAEQGDALSKRMALLALTRIAVSEGDGKAASVDPAGSRPGSRDLPWQAEAIQAMANAVFLGDDEGRRGRADAEALARTAVASLAAMAAIGSGPRPRVEREPAMPVPEGALDADTLFGWLTPREVSRADREAALLRFGDALQRSALTALRTSGARAQAVLDALGSGDGELAPFVGRDASPAARERAAVIIAALGPSIVPLTQHPDAGIRAKAIVLSAGLSTPAAQEAIATALGDTHEDVQRVALGAVSAGRPGGERSASPAVAAAVGRILAGHESWAMRVLAARAMARLGASGAGAEAIEGLTAAATADSYALVRQAALEGLAEVDVGRARVLASKVAVDDPEPRVREAARAIADRPRSP
jgi:tetratricopeptide (TPR) repeat protein/HEAT repeat protein